MPMVRQLVLNLQSKPGVLPEAAEKGGRAKVNITCAYATMGGAGPAAVILTVSNLPKAIAALGG